MQFSTPYEWLNWISAQNTKEIDLSLERVLAVATRLGITSANVPVITVAGTNGKGTTVATLESIYAAAGFAVGAFTSPYFFYPNEQIKLDGKTISDMEFCQALAAVDQARGSIRLTPFEFQTLAAIWLFLHFPLDVWVLEVGLGGRFDAVNIISADVAIVTSIALDHMNYLGDTRDAIAREKAGIFRPGQLAICGDENPPATLVTYAHEIGAQLKCVGKEFHYTEEEKVWHWTSAQHAYHHLPRKQFLPQNLATALMAITDLQTTLPVSDTALISGLNTMHAPARLEKMHDEKYVEIHDVSHNPAAIAVLANYLKTQKKSKYTHAVFSMLGDKDIVSSLAQITEQIDQWYVAPISHPRAANLETLQNAFMQLNLSNVQFFSSLADAFGQAKIQRTDLVVFGSFHTVAEVRKAAAILKAREVTPTSWTRR